MRVFEAAHVMGRVAGPALAPDILVEPAVAVRDDVEPGNLLFAQINGSVSTYCSRKRLVTIASRNDRMPRFSVYQLGRGSDPVIVVGSMMSFVARYIFAISQNAERDFRPLTGRWYSLPAQRKQQKSRRQPPPAHLMRSVGLGDCPDGRQAMHSAGIASSEDQAGTSAPPAGALCKALRDRLKY